MKQGKLYVVKNTKENFWEINENNHIVCMTVPGFLEKISKKPMLYLGVESIGLSFRYKLLCNRLIYTFHKSFLNDLRILKYK